MVHKNSNKKTNLIGRRDYSKNKNRGRHTNNWIEYFETKYERKPTNGEGNIFGTGFNAGWKSANKLSNKRLKERLSDFYNEFDLSSNCTKDDKLFKKLWNKYFAESGGQE